MSGSLCSDCGAQCQRLQNLIECPRCSGAGCTDSPDCLNGMIQIDECPRLYVGTEFTRCMNLASICGKGDWPNSGGLLDQSPWFLSAQMMLRSELNKIEREQMEARTKANGRT